MIVSLWMMAQRGDVAFIPILRAKISTVALSVPRANVQGLSSEHDSLVHQETPRSVVSR